MWHWPTGALLLVWCTYNIVESTILLVNQTRVSPNWTFFIFFLSTRKVLTGRKNVKSTRKIVKTTLLSVSSWQTCDSFLIYVRMMISPNIDIFRNAKILYLELILKTISTTETRKNYSDYPILNVYLIYIPTKHLVEFIQSIQAIMSVFS